MDTSLAGGRARSLLQLSKAVTYDSHLAVDTSLASGTGGKCGKRKPMRSASASPSGHVCCVGVPSTAQILCSSSGCAGKKGEGG